jgi:hypothetical protein
VTEQLHDLMTAIADRAGPGGRDPALWARARKARRDRRRLRVAAVAVTVAAVLGTLTFAGVEEARRDEPPPVEQPHRSEGPGIPSTVYAVPGDGGLPLETDLAVGRASVALTNSSGAFVVTADDGVYHRLRLPGYYPVPFSAGLAGLALSPDGRQLVWSWHSAERPGRDERPGTWGLRLADLTTGAVRTVGPGFLDGSGVHSNPRWSPDGRYVVADQVYGIEIDERWAPPAADANYAIEYFGAVLDTRRMRLASIVGSYLDGSPYDAWVVAPSRRAYRVVGDRLLTWAHEHGREAWRRSTLATGVSGSSTGRISGDGRWLLLSGRDGTTGVALVDLEARDRPATVVRVETGAEVDVLGWTDDRHVLALQGPVEADRTLVRLALEPPELASERTSSAQLDVERLGSFLGAGEDTTVSIAADLAAGDRTTWDADAPSFATAEPEAAGTPDDGSVPASQDAQDPQDGRSSVSLLGVGGAVAAALLALALGLRRRRRPARG